MRERLRDIIATRLSIDMNDNGMQISEDTMAILTFDSVTGASQGGIEAVRDWFNSKNVALLPEKEQRRYVDAVTNLLLLIATNDVESLVKNWMLADI